MTFNEALTNPLSEFHPPLGGTDEMGGGAVELRSYIMEPKIKERRITKFFHGKNYNIETEYIGRIEKIRA